MAKRRKKRVRRRKPARRKPARRRNARRLARPVRRRPIRRRPTRRATPGRPVRRRNARRGRKPVRRRRKPARRQKLTLRRMRNAGVTGAKTIAIGGLKVGAGVIGGLTAAQMVTDATGSPYGRVGGSVLAAAAFYLAQKKVAVVQKLDPKNLMAIGAGATALHGLAILALQRGILPASVAPYIPGAMAPMAVAPMAVGPAEANGGAGAYVSQAALYGMGATPIEAAMQHKLNMIEGGMSGGIFDSPTTLGEYDVLASAPSGTTVQSAMAEYTPYPPMGATVEQATAGMGATVQEAFAGPSLKEYVTVPLSDYVPTGPGMTYPGAPVAYSQIRQAAANITAKRRAQGLPTGPAFLQNLIAAGKSAIQDTSKTIGMDHPASPLTVEAAPFPGAQVADVGGTAGQPASLTEPFMDDDAEGIFS